MSFAEVALAVLGVPLAIGALILMKIGLMKIESWERRHVGNAKAKIAELQAPALARQADIDAIREETRRIKANTARINRGGS